MTKYTLIADDDPVVIFLMGKLLKKAAFGEPQLSFDDGIDALNRLREMYNADDIFIIFLDIHMPEMDAWNFLEEIAQFAKPVNTLVVIITSSTDKDDAVRAANNPFVKKFIVKPVLKETVSELRDEIFKNAGKK